jgi:small GTP-binding protein
MAAKVVFVGDSGVGKTAVIHRGQNNQFGATQATIGSAEFKINVQVSGTPVQLDVWDTAGQDTYAALVPHYVRQAKACVLTFSLTDELSLDSIPQWAKIVNEHEEIPHIFVVGNKLDLAGDRQVTLERAQQVANGINAEYFQTSAKTSDGIEALFADIAKTICQRGAPAETATSVALGTKTQEKKKKKVC